MSDDLLGKVAQLLSEPPTLDVRRPRTKISTGGPIGLALTVFGMATRMVCEASYSAAVEDWALRRARLRELEHLISSDALDDAGREAMRGEVETLRVDGRAQ
ncbi:MULTISPECIES: hypothetical protein [unclassified Mycobacterium]|uniref:hypothetical protein n=1 Tax=unclassified Mycobacterium TaxID=2642494 RepID=UPI0008004CF6|nr:MULTISPECIES: hypothetical protein [unclassified Mycobacterium]OBG78970.1 hypothetical protein A5700_15380 [Mycobacterium sp. E1214]OBH24424.1 hypothetical protein A5693_08120 [Mycobacterium sp. E1319]